jgi:hypothetical protein
MIQYSAHEYEAAARSAAHVQAIIARRSRGEGIYGGYDPHQQLQQPRPEKQLQRSVIMLQLWSLPSQCHLLYNYIGVMMTCDHLNYQ